MTEGKFPLTLDPGTVGKFVIIQLPGKPPVIVGQSVDWPTIHDIEDGDDLCLELWHQMEKIATKIPIHKKIATKYLEGQGMDPSPDDLKALVSGAWYAVGNGVMIFFGSSQAYRQAQKEILENLTRDCDLKLKVEFCYPYNE